MAEVLDKKPGRGRGRPPGAKNKPKPKVPLVQDRQKIDLFSLGEFKLTPKIVREIKRLADTSQFTLARVFEDVCTNGVIAVQNMYVGVVETRKALQEQLDHLADSKINEVRQTVNPPNTRNESGTEIRESNDFGAIGLNPRGEDFESFPEEFHDQFDDPAPEPGGLEEASSPSVEDLDELGLDEPQVPENEMEETPRNE